MSTTTAPAQRDTSRARGLAHLNPSLLPAIAAIVILVGMVVYGQLAYGRIVLASQFSSLLINQSQLIIIAIGMTLVIITGGIDLSVGAVVALSGVSGALLAEAGWNPWLVMLVMIGIGSLCGLASGTLIQYFGVQPFIATLSIMFLARGLASMLSTKPIYFPEDSPIRWLGVEIKLIDPPKLSNDLSVTPGVIIALLVVAAAFMVMHRTRTGRTIYAIGGSEQSAQLMGLAVHRTKLMVYLISGTLSGLAAVVYTARLGKAQNIDGMGWELDAIAAAVIGGTLLAGGAGYVLGTVIGALVLGMITVLIVSDGAIPPAATTIIVGGILLAFVLLQRAVSSRRSD
jgi:simple sugar transport system permease protein